MKPYTPKSRIGGAILTYGIQGCLNRESLAPMLRKLRKAEGLIAARNCRDWLIWLGGYPVRNLRKSQVNGDRT